MNLKSQIFLINRTGGSITHLLQGSISIQTNVAALFYCNVAKFEETVIFRDL